MGLLRIKSKLSFVKTVLGCGLIPSQPLSGPHYSSLSIFASGLWAPHLPSTGPTVYPRNSVN